ncbi:MAG: NAD kinase [Bacteroidota bacterium]|nr:NAD kinase [Bacteroidota bacterium]
MTIAVYARSVKDNHPDYIKTLSTKLNKANIKLIINESYYGFLKKEFNFNLEIATYCSHEDIKGKVNYIISLGGDGTILETLDLVRDSGIPVLGVNTGRLGFLASVYKEDFSMAIEYLLGNKFKLDKRTIIELVSHDGLFGDLKWAVNEITILKKDSSSMISIDTTINGAYLNSYWADGLIISTPTGSTAYSLSCGGPIMVPDAENFVITPIAPHNLNVRPIIISSNSDVRLKIHGRSPEYLMSLDSRSATIDAGNEVQIKKANFTFNLISLDSQHFFKTLRDKLMWGIDKRN